MFELKNQEKIFIFTIILSYILYFIAILGISTQAPVYLNYLEIFIKVYVSLFLIIRFNPFTTINFTHLDRRIAFSAGLFLFSTSIINQILKNYFKKIKFFILEQLNSL